MSGLFCGGCGEGDLVPHPAGPGTQPVICDLCGWTADSDALPRQWPVGDDPVWIKREQKRMGRLHFLWIDLDPEDGRAVEGVLGILGLAGMSVAERTLVELKTRPTAEMLGQLEQIPGVTRVWLAP